MVGECLRAPLATLVPRAQSGNRWRQVKVLDAHIQEWRWDGLVKRAVYWWLRVHSLPASVFRMSKASARRLRLPSVICRRSGRLVLTRAHRAWSRPGSLLLSLSFRSKIARVRRGCTGGRLGAPVARIGQPANPEPNGATRGARRANGAQTDWSMPGLCRSTQKSPTDVSLQRAGAAVNQKRTARRRH